MEEATRHGHTKISGILQSHRLVDQNPLSDPISNNTITEDKNLPIGGTTSDKEAAKRNGRKRDWEGNYVNDPKETIFVRDNESDGESTTTTTTLRQTRRKRANDQPNTFPEHIWQKIGSYFHDIQTLIRYLNQRRADHVHDIRFVQDDFGVYNIPVMKRLLHTLLVCQIHKGTPLQQKALRSSLAQLFVWASVGGHMEDALLLLRHSRFDPAADNNCAICWASESGHTELVRLLLKDPRVDPAARDNQTFRWASRKGQTEVVHLLLNDPRVDPASSHNYAIRYASCGGHTEIVRLLLNDPRVDPADDDNFAFLEACVNGHAKIVRLLLSDPRVDPAAENNCSILESTVNGHTGVVRLLLKDPRIDLTVDEENGDIYDAIFEARKRGHTGVFRLLLNDERIDPLIACF